MIFGTRCAEMELDAHKRTLLLRDEIGTHSFTIAHRFQLTKKISRHKRTNYFFAASSSNIYTKTFEGIDVAGRRLAKEVCSRDSSVMFLVY